MRISIFVTLREHCLGNYWLRSGEANSGNGSSDENKNLYSCRSTAHFTVLIRCVCFVYLFVDNIFFSFLVWQFLFGPCKRHPFGNVIVAIHFSFIESIRVQCVFVSVSMFIISTIYCYCYCRCCIRSSRFFLSPLAAVFFLPAKSILKFLAKIFRWSFFFVILHLRK